VYRDEVVRILPNQPLVLRPLTRDHLAAIASRVRSLFTVSQSFDKTNPLAAASRRSVAADSSE